MEVFIVLDAAAALVTPCLDIALLISALFNPVLACPLPSAMADSYSEEPDDTLLGLAHLGSLDPIGPDKSPHVWIETERRTSSVDSSILFPFPLSVLTYGSPHRPVP